MRPREPFDLEAYTERTRHGPCFVCEFLSGNPEFHHHAVYEDDFAVAFLAQVRDRHGVLTVPAFGYTLVVPREHRTEVTGDFTLDEYLRLQAVVHRVAQALRAELPTERIYVLSLGSRQGNAHVHWHLAALPPGVPYEEQQFHFLMAEHGVVRVTDGELADLAARLRGRLSG